MKEIPVSGLFIRPFHAFANDWMALTVKMACFGGEKKKALGTIGSHSGRDGDKLAAAGLTPVDDGD
ncbi:MAG: hypothetical protein SOV73_05005 [Candidatus Faecivivens sp.]|nr:hypothetical protein [Oscillospiraceae bacterium]MDY2712675.1 hypothetical protein [Candidatus Faecivivens sp.]